VTQRQITHPYGALPMCTCGREPRHYGGDLLECARCDRSTGKHATFDLARAEWIRLVPVQTQFIERQPWHPRAARGGQ
jgi:hypothetical protein